MDHVQNLKFYVQPNNLVQLITLDVGTMNVY